jgi:hypothetical protein
MHQGYGPNISCVQNVNTAYATISRTQRLQRAEVIKHMPELASENSMMPHHHTSRIQRAHCGLITLTIELDPTDIIPDTWKVAVYITECVDWLYDGKASGEKHAKDTAVNMARHGCREQGIPEPCGLEELRWEPIAEG